MLLTGRDNLKIGINAWNANLIDGFINKSATSEEIVNKIEGLSFKYFIDRTESLKQHLEPSHKLPLSDKLFINYFLKVFKNNNIKDYYLFDKNGSLLMKNQNNQKSVLIVHTEDSLTQFLKLLAEQIEYKEIYKLIKNKEKMPYINNTESLNYDSLKENLYTPEISIGRETYYIHPLTI